jgi:hypothetical protein
MPVTLGAQQTSTTVRPATGFPATNLVKTSFFFEIDPECKAEALPILGIALMRGFRIDLLSSQCQSTRRTVPSATRAISGDEAFMRMRQEERSE